MKVCPACRIDYGGGEVFCPVDATRLITTSQMSASPLDPNDPLIGNVLGAGIALRDNMREGMPVSITYGLGIAFLYWIFNSFCLSLGYAEMMPPVIAAWLANLVFFSFAGFLLLIAN